jgi:pimeloyl-ACP methyl ester carboxylesterase
VLFVLVHGSWHGPWVWERVGAVLRDRGHDVVAPTLPTDELTTTWQDYADEILDAMGNRAEEAVLVGHSLGAVPVAIAASRAAPRLVVYLTPSTPARELPDDRPARFKPGFEALVRYDGQGLDFLDTEGAVRVFYARLDPTTARWAASRLRPDADHGELELEGPPLVPSAFVYARHDEVFTTEGMVWAARHVFGVEPIEIETGHTPQLEAPNDLADLLENLARPYGHVVAPPVE